MVYPIAPLHILNLALHLIEQFLTQRVIAMNIKRSDHKSLIYYLLATVLFFSITPAQGRNYSIQIASMTSTAEAKAIIAALSARGISAYMVKADVPGMGTRYRVRIGRFKSQNDAKAAAEQYLSRNAIKEFIITPYDAPTGELNIPREAKARVAVTPAPKPEQTEKELPGEGKPAAKEKLAGRQSRPRSVGTEKITGESTTEPSAPVDEKDRGVDKPTKIVQEQESPTSLSEKASKASSESTISAATVPASESAASTPIIKTDESSKANPGSESTKNETAAKKSAPAQPLSHDIHPPAAAIARKTPSDNSIATPPVADAMGDLTIANENWKVVRRSGETDKNLRAIYFVDSMTGWAAGDAGLVHRTTDGGKTWKPLLTGVAANINHIFFVDWNFGWMLGEAGNGLPSDESEDGTTLLMTTNGGRTWARRPLPNAVGVYFIDQKRGWAVGKNASLMTTNDGGMEWSKVESIEKLTGLPVESSSYNFGFRDICFIDSEHGWLIGNFYGRARNHIGGIFTTTDGGETWKRVPITIQTQYSSGKFTPGQLHSVRFSDATNGSITGEMHDGDGRFFFVLHTRDGGKTWEQFRTPSRATHSTQFLDMTNGWTAAFAPREGNADAVVYDTTLMRTDNGGMSWRNDFVARGRRIRSVFFLNPARGWAVGDRGLILRYEEKSRDD